ncbi:D-alanyl-D-alanine carboxypeptidase family protein [Tissierella sp. Yu-01]|uniref:D-alanyl-D-alanine carboxypeptidase family protein n=1 Tax=Tissierella sp. Yu-01 TaxID=3035694 RepID=UPI00240DADB0|nr:D-alanyl-D-alanine carboxypeptidase family protein [Tissierella sp. Yu-01]WFA09711.1 D-alanyl-D-alanine carboxypeptidase [Tissierella sp. Yu-01]
MRKTLIFIVLFVLIMSNEVVGSSLDLSGQSYILIEENSGRVLLEKDSHKKMAMASTTKIMTALIAIEKGNLDDVVSIGEDSVNIEGSSIYLGVGEKVKMIDLIYGLMLRSGNDSAVAIANHISKSEEDFVSLMNQKAKKIGAQNTNFMNPHGLYHENHYSTAHDLSLITREAFKYSEFEDISNSKVYTGSRERENYFVNKNKTLWEYEGGDGVKIGYTMSSGRCLVSSATRDNMRLIAVSLNAPNWFNDNYKLMDYGFNNYKLYNIYEKDQLITQANVIEGIKEKIALVSEKDFLYPLKEDEIDKVKLTVNISNEINAPIKKGDILGDVEVYLEGSVIRKDNLIAKYDVDRKSFLTRLLDDIRTIYN